MKKKLYFEPTRPTKLDEFVNIKEGKIRTLLMYIKMISFMFWRPIETVRIKIEDIDFDKKTMTTETKTKQRKVKIIPSIILDEVKDYIGERKGFFFDLKASTDINRRTHLTNRFKKLRERNGIDPSITPYTFRHYFITRIYLQLRKSKSIKDTITELSLITGHTSKAILNYIHVNDIELPEDYSDLLS